MPSAWSAYEPWIRFGAAFGVFAAVALWELALPRRPQAHGRWRRWPSNLGIVAVDALLLRIALPLAAVGVATIGESAGWGLLGLVALPAWAEILIAVLVLDLAIYFQHVLFHYVPTLWRLHRMHHADLEFDTTTGLRFHPVEILLSMAIKMAVVAGIGAPVLSVVIFEVLLNAASLFNHANARLAPAADRLLRWVLVTPDTHRVHHSVVPGETNSNFGFSVTWWDRMFGTYRAQPAAGHDGMTIGLPLFRDPRELRLDRLLTQPFRSAGALDGAADGASDLPSAGRMR